MNSLFVPLYTLATSSAGSLGRRGLGVASTDAPPLSVEPDVDLVDSPDLPAFFSLLLRLQKAQAQIREQEELEAVSWLNSQGTTGRAVASILKGWSKSTVHGDLDRSNCEDPLNFSGPSLLFIS